MTSAQNAVRPLPEARRQQIVEAARACVRRAGFHGASMHEIAREAGLSVGQIYRYFDNKEAIIAAIVAQDLAEKQERFAAFEGEPGAIEDILVKHCGEGIDNCYERDRAALILEVLSEAARNPRVERMLRDKDEQERMLKRRLFDRARHRGWTEREIEARGEILSAIFDGLIVRGVTNPEADREGMTRVLAIVIRSLFDENT